MAGFMLRMPPSKRRLALAAHTREGEILRTLEEDSQQPGLMHIVSTQDVEPILNANKRRYNDTPGLRRPGLGTLAARIPNVLVEQWIREKGINCFREEDSQKVLALLDSPEYRYLRTAPGRLSRRPVRHYFRASTANGSKIACVHGSLRLQM